MPLRPIARALSAVLAGAVLSGVLAGEAAAASYRQADVQKALAAEFRSSEHGSASTAACAKSKGDTRWACRVKRAGVPASTRFTLTIAGGGRWSTGSFKFPGFTAKYKLSGCCLRRH